MKGMTFAEAVKSDARYCKWFLDTANKAAEAAKAAEEEGQPPARSSQNWTDFVEYLKTSLPEQGPGGAGGAGRFNKPFVQRPRHDTPVSHGSDLSSGLWKLNFGKHAGMTYEEVYQKEQGYCRWLLNQSMHSTKPLGEWVANFVVYIQYRHLKCDPGAGH